MELLYLEIAVATMMVICALMTVEREDLPMRTPTLSAQVALM